MGKKNWIEFDNQENIFQENRKEDYLRKRSKINISKHKKGKKGKTVTLVKGLALSNEIEIKELLKKMKVFCGTGGTVIGEDIQLQGDMKKKLIEFLRQEEIQNL